ncbi:MAG: dephospho-CoA kinase [Planctomycetota bacterium]|jgi:dephospho-CoA kinase
MVRPIIVGIVGGVASGKSTVAAMLGDLGATVLDADAIARETLVDPAVKKDLVESYGAAILGEDSEVDHGSLADAAFGPPPNTEALNTIIHPKVRRRLLEESREVSGPVVIDAALLLEGGLEKDCDLIIFVSASDPVREGRAASRGWPQEERKRREGSQAPVARKLDAAHEVVNNNGALQDLRAQVENLYKERILTAGAG